MAPSAADESGFQVHVGHVLTSHASQGRILVHGANTRHLTPTTHNQITVVSGIIVAGTTSGVIIPSGNNFGQVGTDALRFAEVHAFSGFFGSSTTSIGDDIFSSGYIDGITLKENGATLQTKYLQTADFTTSGDARYFREIPPATRESLIRSLRSEVDPLLPTRCDPSPPAPIAFEMGAVRALRPERPLAPGHLIIEPIEAAESLLHVEDAVLKELMAV